MGYKQYLRRLARYILFAQPKVVTQINIAQINYGEILKDQTIAITGGGRGLGYGMAQKCVSEGAHVIIAGRNVRTLAKAATELGDSVDYIQFDVADIDSHEKFLIACREKFGKTVDSLICNAGISLHEGDFHRVTAESFDRQFNTNFRASYFLSKAFLEMKITEGNGEGNLILLSSESASQNYDIPYGMTKAAINSLTGALSRRVYQYGIRVNAIAPGVTLSDMTKEYADVTDSNLSRNCAAGRIFLPEEVAELACFLLSDASKCISGEVIHCNAGNHLNPFWEISISPTQL